MGSHASLIKPTWVPRKRSPPWSRTAPPRYLYRRPHWTTACRVHSGWLLSNLASGRCSTRCGHRRVPALPPHIIFCSPPCTASVSRDRKRKWRTGIDAASCTRCGAFRPNGSPPRLFGTASNTFRPGALTMSWKRHRPTCWVPGKTNRWSAAGCWLMTRPTSTPMWPARTRAMNWHSVGTTSRAVTICGR